MSYPIQDNNGVAGSSDPVVKIEPGLETDIKMEDISDTEKGEPEKGNSNTGTNKIDCESDSDSEDEDDPIINTIPVHLNGSFKDSKLAPLLLQFPNKSNASQLSKTHITALHKMEIKPNSGVVELRLPLDTNKFFSETVSNKYNISEQVLRGVIIHDEPKGSIKEGNIPSVSILNNFKEQSNIKKENQLEFYQEKSKNNNFLANSSIRAQPGTIGGSRYLVGVQDNNGELHLTPISDTCMLRPHFSYIDNTKTSKAEKEREKERELNSNLNGSNNSNTENSKEKRKNASVVTMSAKSTKENLPRLGGALLSAKLENEEEGQIYDVVLCDNEYLKDHFVESKNTKLKTTTTQDEYLDLLLDLTKS